MKKVRISQSSTQIDEPRARFDSKNLEETLHPYNKDYGMMIVPGTKTPFPKKVKAVDANVLRQRLANLFKTKQEDVESLQSDEVLSSERNSLVERRRLHFENKRAELMKRQYAVLKCTQDMRKIMHEPMERIPGMTIDFPPVSWPKAGQDAPRYTIYS